MLVVIATCPARWATTRGCVSATSSFTLSHPRHPAPGVPHPALSPPGAHFIPSIRPRA